MPSRVQFCIALKYYIPAGLLVTGYTSRKKNYALHLLSDHLPVRKWHKRRSRLYNTHSPNLWMFFFFYQDMHILFVQSLSLLSVTDTRVMERLDPDQVDNYCTIVIRTWSRHWLFTLRQPQSYLRLYSSPSILQPSILRPPLIIRPLDLVPKGNFLC